MGGTVRITGLLAGTKELDKEAAQQVVLETDKNREGIQKQREDSNCKIDGWHGASHSER